MKVAIIGSRNLEISDLARYIPPETAEIVSGGAKGIDSCAKQFALSNGIKYTEFIPDYERYGRAAPIRRNDKIIEYADVVIAFWNGKSKGTQYVIESCNKKNKQVRVIEL